MEETSKILLSVQEFAKITGLGEKSIRRLSHVQGFPAIRIGHRIMIHKRSAEDWLAECAAHQDACLPSIEL
ncbi:helix-turn-helix domain-containing protein [Selenomonas ruminantium]|jgi:excisionase family DNA binding protein|uniref:DNA binding domain-containing protein, excisionase family n=1 Tax=Selenomonas ruminantium TaxID=971 RepID=A0A1I0YJ02_SELRU|nr:helix-turn-helix domain-containing protein [Selenomonas ruminantium]SFB13162.1 DNA binding domain-containing protein, excisionase family [Selenomonas ruminantium]